MNEPFPQDKWLDRYKELESNYNKLMGKIYKLAEVVQPATDDEWGMHVIDIAIKRLKEYKAKEKA